MFLIFNCSVIACSLEVEFWRSLVIIEQRLHSSWAKPRDKRAEVQITGHTQISWHNITVPRCFMNTYEKISTCEQQLLLEDEQVLYTTLFWERNRTLTVHVIKTGDKAGKGDNSPPLAQLPLNISATFHRKVTKDWLQMHVFHSETRNATVSPSPLSHSLVILSIHFEAAKLHDYIKKLRK